jgi:hypothetical protein
VLDSIRSHFGSRRLLPVIFASDKFDYNSQCDSDGFQHFHFGFGIVLALGAW